MTEVAWPEGLLNAQRSPRTDARVSSAAVGARRSLAGHAPRRLRRHRDRGPGASSAEATDDESSQGPVQVPQRRAVLGDWSTPDLACDRVVATSSPRLLTCTRPARGRRVKVFWTSVRKPPASEGTARACGTGFPLQPDRPSRHADHLGRARRRPASRRPSVRAPVAPSSARRPPRLVSQDYELDTPAHATTSTSSATGDRATARRRCHRTRRRSRSTARPNLTTGLGARGQSSSCPGARATWRAHSHEPSIAWLVPLSVSTSPVLGPRQRTRPGQFAVDQ